MECNKDDAIRARDIAEKKMANNDFAAAKRFALKAQQLYANLDSISMILAVCEVHCSAQNKKAGLGVNWYDVLQVEKMADEITIKKQYRKLALLLHPDKNKFSGAEAAFKLIGEANGVLSNKMTRPVFDKQVKASTQTSISAKPPFHPSSGSSSFNKQQKSEDKSCQQNSHMFEQDTEIFWTRCPSCNTSYEYFKPVLRKQLLCQCCKTIFIAYETVAPANQSNANSSQTEFSGKRNSSMHTCGEASEKGVEINRESNGHSVHNNMRTSPAKAGLSDKKSNKKSNADGGIKLDAHKKGQKTGEWKPVMSKASRNTSKKRGRQGVVESSQSSGGVGGVHVRAEVNQENSSAKQEGSSDAKRPSQNKINALYSEISGAGSELAESTKMSETTCSDNKKESHMGEGPKNGHINVTSHTENLTIKKRRLNRKSFNTLDEDKSSAFAEDDIDSAPATSPVRYDCPDSEFYDFDKCKEKSCFAVDQIWAVYDPVDAMPRFYAQVQDVYPPDFKLKIIWLESDTCTESKGITKWIKAGLPTACGMFVNGNTEVTIDYLMFSHQMHVETRDKTFVIHPRSGEVWALFRNWDIGWSNDPEKHESFEYDFVIILSNFDLKKGIEVAYLKKLKGFVSLFQQTTREGRFSFRIPPGNLLQFSHRVPHFQMSGNERDDVPLGSYELDAASLPKTFDDEFSEREMEKENKDTSGAASSKQSKENHEEVKAASGLVQSHSSIYKCRLYDANQDSASVNKARDLPKETFERLQINHATLVRRSPRVTKKANNPTVS